MNHIINFIRSMIIIAFGLGISCATTILVMIHGWGMEPKSWAWIIGASVFGHFLGCMISQLALKGND